MSIEVHVVEALAAHDTHGKKHTEYRVLTSLDNGCDGRVVVETKHRFSEFLQLHAVLAGSLSLPAFPAARALIVTDAVKRQRCESLGKFLQDATAAAAKQEQPPLALLDFLRLPAATATPRARVTDLECPSTDEVASPTASSSNSPKTVVSTLDGEDPAVAELVATARAEAKAAAEAAAEWAERAAAAAAFEARAEAAEAALAQASPQRKLRESTAAVEAAEAAVETAEAALAAQARQMADAHEAHEVAVQAARAEAEEALAAARAEAEEALVAARAEAEAAVAAARAEVGEVEERWRAEAYEQARVHAAAIEALRHERAGALEAAVAHERRLCEAVTEEKEQQAVAEATRLRERCAAAEARAEAAEEAHGERGAQLGMMQRAAAAAEKRARRAAVAATAGDVARLEERVAAAEASTMAALARAQAAEARTEEMAASLGLATEAAQEREADVWQLKQALTSAADALAAEEDARRAAVESVVAADSKRGAAADLTYLRGVVLSTLCRALTAETRAEVEALAPPLQAVFGFGADDASRLRSAIEHRYAPTSYAPPSVGALFSSMLSAASAEPFATPRRSGSPLADAGAGLGFLSPLEHLADADAGDSACANERNPANVDMRSPANLDMRRAAQPGLDRNTRRPVARPGQLAHC